MKERVYSGTAVPKMRQHRKRDRGEMDRRWGQRETDHWIGARIGYLAYGVGGAPPSALSETAARDSADSVAPKAQAQSDSRHPLASH